MKREEQHRCIPAYSNTVSTVMAKFVGLYFRKNNDCKNGDGMLNWFCKTIS
jgi:hypothetical protein